jgi:HEAT repeat protein
MKTDDEAVLLSQLDAVMKDAPAGTGGTSKLRRGAAERIRSAAASVTKRVLRPKEEEEEAAEGEAGDEGFPDLPIGKIALGLAGAILLLVVIVLKLWGGGGSGGEVPAGPVEPREVLEAIEDLSPALKDEEPAVRRDAVMALGRYPGPSSEGLILSMLADPEPVVRAEAARVLGQVGRRREVQWRVFRLLSDTSPEVRSCVAEALEKLTGYTRLSTIDWRQSPEGLRRALREEFETWLKRN